MSMLVLGTQPHSLLVPVRCSLAYEIGVGGIGMCAMKTVHAFHLYCNIHEYHQSHRIAHRHLAVVAHRAWSL